MLDNFIENVAKDQKRIIAVISPIIIKNNGCIFLDVCLQRSTRFS